LYHFQERNAMFGWMQLTGHFEIVLRMLPELYKNVFALTNDGNYLEFKQLTEPFFEMLEGNSHSLGQNVTLF